MRIASEVNANPRQLDQIETAGLNLKRTRLKKEHKTLQEKLIKTNDDATIKSLAAEKEIIEAEFEVLDKALKEGGREQARAFGARQAGLDENLDFLSVTARAKANKGAKLTPKEQNNFEVLTKRLDETTIKLDKLQKQVNDGLAGRHIKDTVASKKYKTMSLKQKDIELNSLVEQANKLLKEGCY